MTSEDVITGEAPARYAEALIELADEAKSLTRVEKDLAVLRAAFEDSAELRLMAASALISAEDKINALDAIAKKAKLSPLTQQFIGTVAANRRSAELPAIIRSFTERVAIRRGSQIAQVVSAAKLTQAQTTQLKTRLKAETGRAIEIEASVDPSLLGGFIVKLGSRLYDASLKTKLEDLRLALKSA
ncbi:MAG: F0F1 ATP synthase subunit delta [Litorimonas sp.]